jgi:hypothetical protein
LRRWSVVALLVGHPRHPNCLKGAWDDEDDLDLSD